MLRPLIEELRRLTETPIDSYNLIGDWTKNSSFKDVDRRLLTAPKAIEKVKTQWNKTPFHFDLYFVNDRRVNKPIWREVGEVDWRTIRDDMGIREDEFDDQVPGNITVFYTNNTGAERVMLSGWVMAHRLGHAFSAGRSNTSRAWSDYRDRLHELFSQMMQDVYNFSTGPRFDPEGTQALKFAAQTLGTVKRPRPEGRSLKG